MVGPIVTAGLIAGGASLIAGERANSATAASTQRQMDFQLMMSSTAHQREVRDLKLAGLNPVLSAGGQGASTSSGASYVAQKVDPVSDGINSARAASSTMLTNQQTAASIVLTKAQAANIEQDTLAKEASTSGTQATEKLTLETRLGKRLDRKIKRLSLSEHTVKKALYDALAPHIPEIKSEIMKMIRNPPTEAEAKARFKKLTNTRWSGKNERAAWNWFKSLFPAGTTPWN